MRYYKIDMSSPLGDKVKGLSKKMDECSEAMRKYIELLGCRFYVTPAFGKFYGGISGVQMKEKREGWRIEDKSRDIYYPRKDNKEESEKIKSLPTIEDKEVNAIFKYKPQSVRHDDGKRYWHRTPTLKFYKENNRDKSEGLLLMVEGKQDFTILDGMEEILGSEAEKLMA